MYTLFEEPASDSFSLVGAATELLRELWHGERVNFLAVTLTNLGPPSGQTNFVLEMKRIKGSYEIDRKRLASTAADKIRDRYGDEAIMFGQMLGLGDEAPDRIGFRKVEGVEFK